MYVHPITSYMQTLYIIQNELMYKALIKWTAIEESSSIYIRGLSKIKYIRYIELIS